MQSKSKILISQCIKLTKEGGIVVLMGQDQKTKASQFNRIIWLFLSLHTNLLRQ
jgi:hypothetical protein